MAINEKYFNNMLSWVDETRKKIIFIESEIEKISKLNEDNNKNKCEEKIKSLEKKVKDLSDELVKIEKKLSAIVDELQKKDVVSIEKKFLVLFNDLHKRISALEEKENNIFEEVEKDKKSDKTPKSKN